MAGILGPLGSRQCERSRAELIGERAVELALRVAQASGETGHAIAFDDALADETHGPAGDVLAQTPFGAAGCRLGQASAAGSKSGAMGRGAGREELHIGRLRGAGRATRPTVDAGSAHCHHKLTVESPIT